MKKRIWKLPQSPNESAAVDIPELDQKKKKKGVPFWASFPGSTPAVYGSMGGAIGVDAGGAAIGAAGQTAAMSSSAAAGGLVFAIRSLVSYGPASLLGKLTAGLMLLMSAGALAGGAAFFSAAAAPAGVPLSALGGIVDTLHYSKAPSRSLSYAASAARGPEFSAQQASPQDEGKAADAVAAGGFTGNTAPGAPIGQAGASAGAVAGAPGVGVLSLADSPFGGQEFFDGTLQQATGGAQSQRFIARDGALGGAFEQSTNGGGKAGERVAANMGSPLANLGAFGMASSEGLGLLRSMQGYVPGMTTGTSKTFEAPAQLSAEGFDDNTNLIGASAPSGVGTGGSGDSGSVPPNSGGGSGSGGGTGNPPSSPPNSCAQEGLVWNGSGCVAPSAPPTGSGNSAPWSGQESSMDLLVMGASLLLITAGGLALAAQMAPPPAKAALMMAAKIISIIAAALGAIVLASGTGIFGSLFGQTGTQGAGMTMAGSFIMIAGVIAALMGSTASVIPSIAEMVTGLMSLLTFKPMPPSTQPPVQSGSGGTGGSGGSGGTSGTGGGGGSSGGGS